MCCFLSFHAKLSCDGCYTRSWANNANDNKRCICAFQTYKRNVFRPVCDIVSSFESRLKVNGTHHWTFSVARWMCKISDSRIASWRETSNQLKISAKTLPRHVLDGLFSQNKRGHRGEACKCLVNVDSCLLKIRAGFAKHVGSVNNHCPCYQTSRNDSDRIHIIEMFFFFSVSMCSP